MGVALGLGFWLALALIDTSTLAVLIAHSSDPKTTTVILVSFFTLAFGVGATLTGFGVYDDGNPLERDDFSSNRHLALSFCLSMIFSENRCPLFRIML